MIDTPNEPGLVAQGGELQEDQQFAAWLEEQVRKDRISRGTPRTIVRPAGRNTPGGVGK